jgi:CRISPR/Cas system-associated exonuclease Cas4 (RecB family)
MPKRTDLRSILIIGSGPIVIGQACEFDYSGAQACKVLKSEGFKVILINSNPATIMTDPQMADRTYIEPIEPDFVEKIIEKERPDALLPTLGGQTALNTAIALYEKGILEKYRVEMIGAKPAAIKKAEDRELFKEAMQKIGLDLPKSGRAYSLKEAMEIAKEIGFPLIIRAKGSTTRRILLQAFKDLDIHPSLLIEAGSSEFIKQWVSEGKGISVIVKRTVEDEEKSGIIKIVPLLEKLYLEVAFLYLKEERSTPVIRTFIHYIENKGKKMIKM